MEPDLPVIAGAAPFANHPWKHFAAKSEPTANSSDCRWNPNNSIDFAKGGDFGPSKQSAWGAIWKVAFGEHLKRKRVVKTDIFGWQQHSVKCPQPNSGDYSLIMLIKGFFEFLRRIAENGKNIEKHFGSTGPV